jgi:hypothetical protein
LAKSLTCEKSMTMPLAASPALSMTGARQGDLDHVAVPVQVAALAAVVGDAVAGVEFEAAGNQHGGFVF